MSAGKNNKGFTLIEMMIVVVIVTILAAVTYPSYQNHMIQSSAQTAASDLLALAAALANGYKHNLSYAPVNTASTSETKARTIGWSPAGDSTFVFTMIVTDASYTLKATGINLMTGCNLTLTDDSVRSSTEQCKMPSNW